MTSRTRRYSDISHGEIVCGCMFIIAVIIFIAACTPDKNPPDGCPTPQYKVGDIVLVDEVYISTILEREVLGCGDIRYTVETNVEVDGVPLVLEDIIEGRISPYEPELP